MARPQKVGLDYFPLDVDIDQDDKVAIIEAQHGIVGFSVTIKLLMKIYSEGYYYDWTEKEQILFSKRVNVAINDLNPIISDCVKWGLFDAAMFDKQKILTSRGIQIRYLEAVKRRQRVEVAKEFLLLDDEMVNGYSNLVIVSINDGINEEAEGVNDNINPQSKVKKSKVNKSKEEESIYAAADAAKNNLVPAEKSSGSHKAIEDDGAQSNKAGKDEYTKEFEEFWGNYPRKLDKRKAFRAWRARLKEGADPEQIIKAGINYANYCAKQSFEQKFIKHGSTFLGPDKSFLEFVDGLPEMPEKPGGTDSDPKSWGALRTLYAEYEEEERGVGT